MNSALDKKIYPLHVNLDLCVHCGWCLSYCGYGAYRLDTQGYLQAFPEKCQNCRQCEDACPRNAITLL